MSEWISVNDRLPKLYDFVLVFADNKGSDEPKPIAIARLVNEYGLWDFLGAQPQNSVGAYMNTEYGIDSDDITHWMPLPNAPEKQDS